GPNRMNRAVVRAATAALAGWLQAGHGGPGAAQAGGGLGGRAPPRAGGAAAGGASACDAGPRSGDFADEAARVLAGAGIRAHLLPPQQPTPLLAFAVRHLRGAAGGTMSGTPHPPPPHAGAAAATILPPTNNPPANNGYKLYLSDGAQIIPPVDKQIGTAIAELGDLSSVPAAPADSPLVSRLGDEIANAYLDAIVAAVPGPGGSPGL